MLVVEMSAAAGFQECHESDKIDEPTAAIEELSAQAVIEESSQASSIQDVGGVNAQVSEALLRSGLADSGPRVLLLKLSRRPAALRSLLLEAPELAACRCALESHEFPVELPSGAKIFVRPEHYMPTLEVVRSQGWKLYPDHMFADVDLEPTIMCLLDQLRDRPHSVHSRRTDVVPLAFAQAACRANVEIHVSRTFISIHVPSSLCTSSVSGAPHTASTTDAEPRKVANHRAGRPAKK